MEECHIFKVVKKYIYTHTSDFFQHFYGLIRENINKTQLFQVTGLNVTWKKSPHNTSFTGFTFSIFFATTWTSEKDAPL